MFASQRRQSTKSPDFELTHDDRCEHHECIIELSALEFPEPGRFTLEILYDGDCIGHADVEALFMPTPEYSDGETPDSY